MLEVPLQVPIQTSEFVFEVPFEFARKPRTANMNRTLNANLEA
jgi:hypothetical protein